MDITYTFMIPLLEACAKAFSSYGWAIVVLTVLVRILVWPLVASSTRSMQRMTQLQPKLKIIQERYKSDPQMFQRKAMEFYQKNKVNPFGGCLPTLVQLPVLFALFATFTGPPFQDKAIPVKVNVVTAAEKPQTASSPTSAANSPYVTKDGRLAKVVVHPGDTTLVLEKSGQDATAGKVSLDFWVTACEGTLPHDFKPTWLISSDPNKATINEAGQAVFPQPGDITLEALLPSISQSKAQKIPLTIKVVNNTEEKSNFSPFGGNTDSFQEKSNHSKAVAEVLVNGKTYQVAVSPGESTVKAGKTVTFALKSLDDTLVENIKPVWRIAADPNAASISQEGHANFPHTGSIVIESMIPGVAKEDSFYFISRIGKVAKGLELLQPQNWDVLSMILLFGITMVISQKLMVPSPSANIDPEQAAIQKQTQKTMPIAVTVMFFFIPLPAGVFLYMVISNVIQSLQTWIIMKSPAPELIDVVEHNDGPQDSKLTLIEDTKEPSPKPAAITNNKTSNKKKAKKKK